MTSPSTTQNITVRLDRRTLRKAKILAAKRNTSISGLLAEQIETLVAEDEAYEQAKRRALALLDRDSILVAESSQPVTNGTSDKTFVDSNVLIYAHDVDASRPPAWARSASANDRA